MRVLTWNLFHGRSEPAAGRDLLDEFTACFTRWSWDLALLQEAPPWWPARLAEATGAEQCAALTSRNGGLALRRAAARHWPDLLKSNGGGANAMLSRVAIVERSCCRLRVWPERRVAQLVRLANGLCVVNFHASRRRELAREEVQRLWRLASEWAGERPLLLGGDLNLRQPGVPATLLARTTVDFLFGRGLEARGERECPERVIAAADGRRGGGRSGGGRLQLSDHKALAVSIALADRR